MDDLPELPFEKVLSYLSLEDRLKSKAVSRRWYWMISKFKVKTLCYSQRPTGFIEGKRRLVSGAFAKNFIGTIRFESFFTTFGPTILSNLKHLRLCDLRLNMKTRKSFTRTLQSFGQLEQLDIIRFISHPWSGVGMEFELNLPMLTGIWLEEVSRMRKLTLNAPQLLKIKLKDCGSLNLELVHTERVEWLMKGRGAATAVEKLKNLKYLYIDYMTGFFDVIDPTFLSSFEQLKEIQLEYFERGLLERLFEQKQRHCRTDLKIYSRGLLLNGPDDPLIHSLEGFEHEYFRCLAENPSRLADQIPSWYRINYTKIEPVAPRVEMSLLKRFTNLSWIDVSGPVEDTERFLGILKNLHNIVGLDFVCDQPQDLFDRLPEHCSAVQKLIIRRAPSDIRFLFRLQHLMNLTLYFAIDAEAIRKIIEKNEFLLKFEFNYLDKWVQIEIDNRKRFKVSLGRTSFKKVSDLHSAIQLVTGELRPKKRKAEHLLELPRPVHQPSANVSDRPQVPHDPLARPVSRPEAQFPLIYPVQYIVHCPAQNSVLQYTVNYPV